MTMIIGHNGLTDPGDLLPMPSASGIDRKTTESPAGFISTKDGRVLANDGATNRAILGLRANGTYGLRVSKLGQDVLTGTPDQMVMDSDFNQFKIVATGTFTVNKPASTTGGFGGVTLPLGNIALAYACWLNTGGFAFSLPYIALNNANGTIDVHTQSSISINGDGTLTIAVNILTPSTSSLYASAFDYPFRYYIFKETAS